MSLSSSKAKYFRHQKVLEDAVKVIHMNGVIQVFRRDTMKRFTFEDLRLNAYAVNSVEIARTDLPVFSKGSVNTLSLNSNQ